MWWIRIVAWFALVVLWSIAVPEWWRARKAYHRDRVLNPDLKARATNRWLYNPPDRKKICPKCGELTNDLNDYDWMVSVGMWTLIPTLLVLVFLIVTW